MADIVLISPRFENCFWGLDLAAPILGKKASLPQTVLSLLAALTPPEHRITIIDENVEDIDLRRCVEADIVAMTGMNVQRFRMKALLAELKALGCYTVVGGPWVSARPDYFGPLADVVFIGEADESWPRFLKDWTAGRPAASYRQDAHTDLSRLPVPRFEALKNKRYAFGTLQLSRGCPHQCEFCDIIVMFGRRPRSKTGPQAAAELDALRKAGHRLVFVVDDNFIGDKKAARSILGEMIAWQRRNGYPLAFMTQATLGLADEPELLDLMIEANFIIVFLGVESLDPDSLLEAGKRHNLRGTEPFEDRIRRIQRAGLVVWCGMIQGFDHDDAGVFGRQLEFLTAARVPMVMSGMLTAIPGTPLHERLDREGRLDPADPPAFGTNVIPKRMTGPELQAAYVRHQMALYEPDPFFRRLDALFFDPEFEVGFARQGSYWKRHRIRKAGREAGYALRLIGLWIAVRTRVPDRALRRSYRRHFLRLLKVHRRPGLLLNYSLHVAMQYHAGTLARRMADGRMPVTNTY